MILRDLIKGVDGKITSGSADVDISDIAYRASDVLPGMCFVAVRGAKTDGHLFIEDAIQRGACAIVGERVADVEGVVSVIVKDSRRALSKMSSNFFGNPSREMTLVGVTGTNGKTTTTYLLEAIFKANDKKTGVIGTVEYRIGSSVLSAANTTPESYELQKLLARMRSEKVSTCAMEVSSHALVQGRASDCEFDAAVFTNLTPEHLDYHSDMDSYFDAKALLFEDLLASSPKKDVFAAINTDDEYGLRLARRCKVPVVTYGFAKDAFVRGEDLTFDSNGIAMHVKFSNTSFKCSSKLCGRFNAYNILAAVAVAIQINIPPEVISKAVSDLSFVPGRFEPVKNERGVLALVDYAHTPDALENSLSNAREIAMLRNGKLISVFGCGGDRDRQKRPMMGRVAAALSDIVIVTSDNPRTEDPQKIIDEILPGVKNGKKPLKDEDGYEVISDRRLAIEKAVSLARKNDVLVVAGKGHEDYQIVGDKRTHFSDKEALEEIFGRF